MTQPTERTMPERPVEPLAARVLRWGVLLVVLVPVVWSVMGLELSWARIARAPGLLWAILSDMVPPDFDDWTTSLDAVFDSLYIAWLGTLIGAAVSFVLAFVAARNLTPRPVSAVARFILSAIRAFPELLLAILFIPVVGLGPFAGVLAIGIHSIGTLGKLSGEVIESVDDGPLEALDAVGGTWIQRTRWGVLPQVLPEIVAYWLYRFEINIRASAVLGIIGAGGIGDRLVGLLRFRDFPKAGTVLLLTIVTVLIVDAVSARVRRRIITGRWSSPRQAVVTPPVAVTT